MNIKEKLNSELKKAKISKGAEVVKSGVLQALVSFAEQNLEFAQAIEQSDKSFADCLETTVKGTGNGISDLDAYKRAVTFYFPGADVKCTMTIDLGDGGFSNSEPVPENKAIEVSLDSLLDF